MALVIMRTHNSHWGAFRPVVSGGRVNSVAPLLEPIGEDALVAGIPAALHHSSRVEFPCVRKSWLEQRHRAGGALRGREEFVRVSWDVAVELVAEELLRVRNTYGNSAIFGGSYGWSSAGRFHHAKTQLNRFLACFGGYTGQINNYSYAAASAILPHVVGSADAASGQVPDWDTIAEHTRLFVAFGGLPPKNMQIESGGVTLHDPHWVGRAHRRGASFVSISPLSDDISSVAEADWIAIRPGTDVALMLAVGYVLLTEHLYDRAFVDRYCTGFDRIRDYLLGVEDGVHKSPRWASEITGVPAGTIEDLSRRMARARTLVTATWSLQRAAHGEQPYWMVVVLAAMLGGIGLPGGGFGFGYGNTATIGRPGYPLIGLRMSAGKNPAESSIPVARIADMLLNPGSQYTFDGHDRVYPHVRLIYWAGGNPFHHHQDLNRLASAWRNPETVIVHEPWWTATAKMADIVLPATTTLERNDIAGNSRDARLVAMHKALDPIGEARSDYSILSSVARQVGIADVFTGERSEMDWLAHLYDGVRAQATAMDVFLPEFAEFWDRGVVELPCADQPRVPFAEFRADPVGAALSTPSGKIELFSAEIAGFGYSDCAGSPVWLEPPEWLGSQLVERFPLHLISNQPATRLHGQLDMVGASKASKIKGREPCRMNPKDAAERGIADGDVVRLFNDRGACLAGAMVSVFVMPGVVQLSTGAWYDPLVAGTEITLDKHGNPNVLTVDRGTSSLGQGPSAQTALVQVERFLGELPPVTAHQRPRISD